jgi:hypothetical protein
MDPGQIPIAGFPVATSAKGGRYFFGQTGDPPVSTPAAEWEMTNR